MLGHSVQWLAVLPPLRPTLRVMLRPILRLLLSLGGCAVQKEETAVFIQKSTKTLIMNAALGAGVQFSHRAVTAGQLSRLAGAGGWKHLSTMLVCLRHSDAQSLC